MPKAYSKAGEEIVSRAAQATAMFLSQRQTYFAFVGDGEQKALK